MRRNVKNFKNISIMFEHAKKTAIVGPSGAGKTSLLNLLPRFYDLQKGEILINDTNVITNNYLSYSFITLIFI